MDIYPQDKGADEEERANHILKYGSVSKMSFRWVPAQ